MTLANLKTQLQIVTGTGIGDVYFDWNAYMNDKRDKTYPVILWSLDGTKFKQDYRSSTTQKLKLFTITVYAMAYFSPTKDKITEWDALETKVKAYFNLVNRNTSLEVHNIDAIDGQYAGEGLLSADMEIGIIYEGIQLKVFC